MLAFAFTAAGAGMLGLPLVPVVAFTLLNWGAGLAGVRRSTFLWTTGPTLAGRPGYRPADGTAMLEGVAGNAHTSGRGAVR